MMQPEIELEQAVGPQQAIAAGMEATEGKGVYLGLLATITTAFLALIGWVVKSSMARQRVHDTASDITVVSLRSAQERITELEAQVRTLLNEAVTNSRAQIEAYSAAQRAADSAAHASAMAEEAQRNAVRAREETEAARGVLAVWMAYSSRLRALMIEAGLPPPPPPEPEP